MDYFIITEFNTILDYMTSFSENSIFDTPTSIVVLFLAIIFRPIFSWVGTAYSVYVSQKILRDIEHDVKQRFLGSDKFKKTNFEIEEITNVYITYGRWFVDCFLLPFIRATLEITILLSITFSLATQFPREFLIFSSLLFFFLTTYNLMTKPILKTNGKIFVQTSENLIKKTQNLFDKELKSKNFNSHDSALDETLNQKMKSSIILGMFSQGLKNVIEMAALVSFGITITYVLLFSSSTIAVFGTTFVYAMFRILPSITVLLTFYQQRNNARFAIERLGAIFES